MAHTLSAKKRVRQSDKRHLRNRARKEKLKKAIRGFTDVLSSGDAATIDAQLTLAQKAVDKAQTKGILHRRNADRRKSRLAQAANRALGRGQSAAAE